MEKYRISVIMGIYNCADTLIEALESLENQTYKKFKVILCNDGSKDNTYEIAKKWTESHPNYILIDNGKNLGLNATLNHCLEYVDTEYVARMDGDDISLSHRFKQEIEFLNANPEYAIVSGPMKYFDENGIFKEGRGKGKITRYDFLKGSPICHAPCMVRTKAYRAVNGYSVDKRLLRVEDYHLWFKMYAKGFKAYMLKEPIYAMRDDRNATARRTFSKRLNVMYVMFIGFRMLKMPLWCYIYCLRPIAVGLLPKALYNYLHRR